MRKYDSYKDSGVEWIGEIPSEWKKTKLKFTLEEIVTGGTPDTSNNSYWGDEETGINWISISDITSNGREILETKKFITKEGLESKKLEILPIGSLIYSIYGSIGKVSRLGIPSTVHQGILGLKTNSYLNSIFLEYYLIYFKEYVSLFSSSNTQENLNQDKVSNFELPLPPLSEQQQIVSYLDTKTLLIDSLIEKTKLKIQLLKEKRTSLINEVVTKGLNPNVEMKDSGVEWIGEIPIHWDFVKVGHYSLVVRGGSPRPSGDSRYFNGDYIHWITVKDITSKIGKYVITSDSKLTEEGMKQSRVLEPETLVLTNSGVTLGVPGILKIKGCINDGSVGFLNLSLKVERDFLYYFWTTQTILLLEQQSGYGQPNLNIDIVSNIRFPLPPLSEQNEIVSYLDEHTQLIDKTISVEERRIELLKEYRQSLISEVVTGKRKVVD